MSSPSNIRVSIQFKESTVFAGEDVECIITFKNAARNPNHHRSSSLASAGPIASGHAYRKLPPAPIKRPSLNGGVSPTQARKGSRDGVNLPKSLPNTPTKARPKLSSSVSEQRYAQTKKGHGRSLSILSLSSEAPGSEGGRRSSGHNRSLSAQLGTRRAPLPPPDENDSASQQASSLDPPSITLQDASPPSKGKHKKNPKLTSPTSSNYQRTSSSQQQESKFPSESEELEAEIRNGEPVERTEPAQSRSAHTEAQISNSRDSLNPLSRLITSTSVNGTPRSSTELYSGSNHSDETLASEYLTQPVRPVRNSRYRQSLKLANVEEQAETEVLMMGYAQVMGAFVVDGSLVNQAPFEEVKRKGVVGGQGGGGVVGVESNKKRESGLLGAFGWSNIGESIGGLLGGGELSSIKEMRTIASSKAIPLISTPQSILFVDARLEPGESRRYSYKFTLPRGLPPSHRGRAMKAFYHITIGVQRPGSSSEQRIKSVDVPFRVFGTVNARGDVLAHDLFTPHIYLRDSARTSVVGVESIKKASEEPGDQKTFLAYVKALLEQQMNSQSGSGLLSPTMPTVASMRRASSISEPTTSKEAIDLAIMRLNPPSSQQANLSTRFSIARSKRPVATVLLSRTAYRLGETINLVVDFSPSGGPNTAADGADQWQKENGVQYQSPTTALTKIQVPVYALLVSLETNETVSESIAMRSPPSILRATRKIHAQQAESCLFARRLTFALAIPPTGTPGFETSAIGFKWGIRVEFVTPILQADDPAEDLRREGVEENVGEEAQGMLDSRDLDDDLEMVGVKQSAPHYNNTREREWVDLLEEVHTDDRGRILQGVEHMPVETFEVEVPVRVYGAVSGSKTESDAYDLVV